MMFARWNQAFREWLDDPRFRDNRRLRVGIYVVLGALLYLILVGSVLPQRYEFTVGQTSPVTIVSPVVAVDSQATQAAREQAMNKVPKQYVQLPSVEQNALLNLDKLFAAAAAAISDKSLSQDARIQMIAGQAPAKVSRTAQTALASMTLHQLGIVQSVSERIVENLLGSQFSQQSLHQAPFLIQQLMPLDTDRTSQMVIQSVVQSVLQPNMVYQAAATRRAKQVAAEAVPPVVIQKGDVIVPRNGLVTSTVIGRLHDVGLYGEQPNYGMATGFALFVIIAVGLLAMYVERRQTRRRLDNLLLIIMSLVLVLVAILVSVTKSVIDFGGPQSTAYLVPIALGSMLLSVLMDSSLAAVASFFISLLFGAALNFDFWYAFIGFIGSLVGAYSVSRVTHRGTFMQAGFFVAGTNVLGILAMQLLHGGTNGDWQSFSLHVGLGALNGIICAILTMGILPFFESAFGLLTSIHLLELSNPNNPLLRKVLLEAPGTYHHSLIVGNLAEAAAEIVGADPLVCRVGAYYHDVGKTRRPLFFVENQMTKDNPHDKIAPSLSHLIITSHVSDGLEMLKKAGLPKPIRDICATHHGTTILWYFYNRAREADKNGTVKVDDFRYPGPKPKTRECAIVMICDAVEAAVRAMSRPTPNRVEGVIRKIIRDRLEDGQLDECDLTLQDLDVMVGAFMKTLKGIYHARLEYPDPDKIRKEVAK